jgi:hypothetical protein
VPNLNLRGGVNGLNIDHDFNSNDVEYSADVKLLSGDLLVDWHPFGGSFRLSAGIAYDGNKADVTGRCEQVQVVPRHIHCTRLPFLISYPLAIEVASVFWTRAQLDAVLLHVAYRAATIRPVACRNSGRM